MGLAVFAGHDAAVYQLPPEGQARFSKAANLIFGILPTMVPLTRPKLGPEELEAVEAVLRSGMLVQGKRVAHFEALVAERCDRQHAVAVSSGTAALHLALIGLGVGRGDEVLCPALTWPSPAHAILACNAKPVLVDVDLDEWNSSAEALAEARSPRTAAAIIIDQFGNPVRARAVLEALEGLPLVEDAACAIGSISDDGPCGSIGAVSCLSFHPRKILTTGEGGMCLTDDGGLADRLRALRNHGQSAPGQFVEASLNHRMSDISAALGIVQMSRLDGILARRRELAAMYQRRLPQVAFQRSPGHGEPNYQTLGLLLAVGTNSDRRDEVIAELRDKQVQAGLLSYTLDRVPTIPGAPGRRFPNAGAIVSRGIALPLFPAMTDEQLEFVVTAVHETLGTEAP